MSLRTALLAALLVLPAAAAQATIDVFEIEMFYIEDFEDGVSQGWGIEVDAFGFDIAGITMDVPGGGTEVFTNQGGGDFGFFSGGFGSLAALQAAYPSGTYTFDFTGNMADTSRANIAFAPPSVTGSPGILAPNMGNTTVPTSPTFSYECIGCPSGTFGAYVVDTLLDTDVYELNTTAPITNPTNWTPGALAPSTNYDFEVELFTETISNLATNVGDNFEFLEGSSVVDYISFSTVPEPSTAALTGFGMVALLGFARRLRRR